MLVLDKDGDLVIIPTAEALMERDEYLKKPEIEAVFELLEDHLCNGWRNFRPEEIGALTDCPLILSNDWEEDEGGKPTVVNTLWWHDNYMFQNAIKRILQYEGRLYLSKKES